MNGIKYYALDENEEVPYEFVVIKNVNGEPEFCASFVNTNSLSYGNGVLVKFHQRNDELRAENAKLRKLVCKVIQFEKAGCEGCPYASVCDVDCLYEPDCLMRGDIERDMHELGVEVEQ